MAFQVIWSDRSRAELQGIVETIRADQPSAADRFANELVLRVNRLGQFPRSGAVFTRRRGFEVRQITYRKYRVFFRVRPRLKRIEVLTLWHGARQEPRLRRP